MSRPDDLKLIALDAEDLTVISAHVQDAVLKVGDLAFEPARHRFSLAMNRFAWEAASRRTRGFERRRAMLHFDRVLKVASSRIDRRAPDVVLELLAISFAPDDEPAGVIVLHFAGGPEIRLTVECIEAQLADLGAAWQTKARPAHDLPA
ncbi:MAG: DUF2948 family protein [Bauldia sp.]|nr:DUF2948 family protein [Bauldia sp.]